MDQRQTGGEWEFKIDRWVEPDAREGNRVLAIINMLPPGGSYRIKIAVAKKKDGRYMICRYFRPPYIRGKTNGYDAVKMYGEHIKNLPREGKRAIRKAYPLAVLML